MATAQCTRQLRRWLCAGVAIAGVVIAAACTSTGDESAAEAGELPLVEAPDDQPSSFVGAADGDLFVAVAAVSGAEEPRRVVAYLCDGAGVSEWFTTDAAGDELTLTSAAGATLEVTLTEDAASGTATLADGSTHAFAAAPAASDAGLFRAERRVDGVDYVGGWIVLANGDQRGATKNQGDGTIVGNPTLDPATLQAPIQLGEPVPTTKDTTSPATKGGTTETLSAFEIDPTVPAVTLPGEPQPVPSPLTYIYFRTVIQEVEARRAVLRLVACGRGELAINAGWSLSTAVPIRIGRQRPDPGDPRIWEFLFSNDGDIPIEVTLTVFCARPSG